MIFIRILRWLLFGYFACASAAFAATCAPATSGGNAPSSWPTYCWLDMSTYNDATARSTAGQNFTINLTDGSVLTYTMHVSQTGSANTPYLNAVSAPSWAGAAVGNTAFLGIPNKPILYTANGGTIVTVTFSNITLTPPAGAAPASAYAFVAADAESTNGNEALTFTTNGSNWVVQDQVPPTSGNLYPSTTNSGTVFTETGVGGTVGGYIVTSNSPTTVTAVLQAGGLQGTMFAVRFASIILNKTLVSVRPNASDQFTYSINVTSSGGVLATNTSSGNGNGPFGPISVSLASGLPFTVKEVMAAGSGSALAAYYPSLSCTNTNAGSPTVMPTNLNAASYNFPSLAFDDAITCSFTNTPYPLLTLTKALGTAGRVGFFDQFIMNVSNGGSAVATTTTTGFGSTVTNGTTPRYVATIGSTYSFGEVGAGATNLNFYAPTMTCANAFTTSATVLPTVVGGNVKAQLGDNITCTITNSQKTITGKLQMTKNSSVVWDPINLYTNPKAIPGAVVQYTLKVSNIGQTTIDSNTVALTDPLPGNITMCVSTCLAPVQTTPVLFTDGSPSSALTESTANVSFSSSSSSNYTPVADSNGYDNKVIGVKITPTGTMMAATTAGTPPSFTIQFLGRIN